MATFEIRKKNSSDIWEHIWLGAELNLILSDGYFRMVDDTFQLYGSSSGNMRYAPLSEIVLYDETASGIPETFTDVLTFVTRLRSLNYPYFYQKALNTTSVESIFGRGGNVVAEIGDYSASQINNDSTVFGATVLDALQYLEGLISPSNGDMLKSVYDPNEVEGDAFDMDNMSQGVTNQFISQSDRTLLNNTSGTNTGDQDLSNYIPEAPNDGQQYARQSEAWSVVSGGDITPPTLQQVLDESNTSTTGADFTDTRINLVTTNNSTISELGQLLLLKNSLDASTSNFLSVYASNKINAGVSGTASGIYTYNNINTNEEVAFYRGFNNQLDVDGDGDIGSVYNIFNGAYLKNNNIDSGIVRNADFFYSSWNYAQIDNTDGGNTVTNVNQFASSVNTANVKDPNARVEILWPLRASSDITAGTVKQVEAFSLDLDILGSAVVEGFVAGLSLSISDTTSTGQVKETPWMIYSEDDFPSRFKGTVESKNFLLATRDITTSGTATGTVPYELEDLTASFLTTAQVGDRVERPGNYSIIMSVDSDTKLTLSTDNFSSGALGGAYDIVHIYYGALEKETLTDDRTWTFPDKSGTVSMLSDVGVQSIQEGSNITIDNTDPNNPIISASISGSVPTLQQVITEGNSSTLPVIIDNKNTTPTQFFGSALFTVESLMNVNGTSVGAALDHYRNPTADSSGSDIYATFNRLVSESDFRDGRLQAFYSQAKYGGTAGLDTSMYGGRLESVFEGSGGIGSGSGSSDGFLIGVRSYTANKASDNSNINFIRAYDSEAVMDSTNGTIDYLQGHHNNVTLIKGTVNNDVSINYLDFDYTDGVVNGDFAYITTKDTGIDFSFVNGTARFIDSLVPLPSRFGGSVESTQLIVTGKTNDDILLGDGSTTSLSGISAFSGDYNDLTNKPTTITASQANEISANTLKVSYDDAAAVALNTAKIGITAQQASNITSNNSKISYTDAAEVSANTLKNSYPSADATKLGNIEDNAQVNVQADWNATSGDALILNKPTIPVAFSGDYNDLSNKPVTITGTNLEVGDGTITNTKVNGSLALGTDTAFQKLHIVDGNALLQAGGEVAIIMKRDVTFTNSHTSSPFVNPIFQVGRIIQGGDGAPQFRWMYSDDNTGETVVMELDSEGIMSSVRQERGSHFEAHIEGEANPFFRLNSSPDMRLEMGPGGSFATDVAVCRSAAETLSFCVGTGASEEQVINIKSTGAEYSKDYSSSYTDRSLIDKAHLDSKLFTEKSFTINDPINEIIPLFVLGQSITISELRVAKIGSGDVEYKLGFGSSLGTIDTDITTNQTQSSSSSTLVNSFSNDTVSANEFVFLQIVNANSATQFHITIKYN